MDWITILNRDNRKFKIWRLTMRIFHKLILRQGDSMKNVFKGSNKHKHSNKNKLNR